MTKLAKEQILSIAPDAASAKAGQQLATRSQWKSLGCTERAAWGEIQGSGKTPYQVRVDLRDQATKCSCPSRKFPCKHALGLMLLAAEKVDFATAAPPQWVTDWLDGRDERAEKRKTAEAQPAEPIRDEAAAAKRAKSRERRVSDGLAELSLWMQDLVRTGLAAARQHPTSFWESVAARMVDAQAPGLARFIRLLYTAVFSGDGWQQRALRTLGMVQLLIEAHCRLDELPAEVQATVRTMIGWAPEKEEVLRGPAARDDWYVLGQVVDEEDRLRSRRTWLFGAKGRRPAMILDFAPGQRPFEPAPPIGAVIDAELCFYPGACPLRALIKTQHGEPRPCGSSSPGVSIEQAVSAQAEVLAVNPWVEQWPMALAGVTPTSMKQADGVVRWAVADAGGASLPLHPRFEQGWELLAISGGRDLSVFGEWDGEFLAPLSAMMDGRLFALLSMGDTARLRRIA